MNLRGIGRDAALPEAFGIGAARRPYLNVRWLGRMEFAHALAVAGRTRCEKKGGRVA